MKKAVRLVGLTVSFMYLLVVLQILLNCFQQRQLLLFGTRQLCEVLLYRLSMNNSYSFL